MSGESAESRAYDKGNDDDGIDPALAEFGFVFFEDSAVQIENGLAHIVCAESGGKFCAAAIGESVVLKGAQESDGNVSEPIGSVFWYERDRRECNDFEACDGDIGMFAFEDGGENGGNEDAEEIGENRKQVTGSIGEFTGA